MEYVELFSQCSYALVDCGFLAFLGFGVCKV